MIRKELKFLKEKWIEFDEKRPGELRKYWIPFILGIVFSSIAPLILNFILLFPLLVILIPILVIISALPSLNIKSNSEIKSGLVDQNGMTEEERKGMMEGIWLLEKSRSMLGTISGIILVVPLFFAPLTQNITASLILSFPILEDLSFNLSFVNFNLLAWIKTILNIIQFMIVFYFTRKVRNTIKKKIINRIEKKQDFTRYIQRINKLGKKKRFTISL
ncbi:MAG: hypothetical protein ACXAC7_21905 [Candidatus Hodarchaeales archaeon]|jgi:hypothetical protein